MHLVQILLPLYDRAGRPFARRELDEAIAELSGRFGGVTAYSRAPAIGLWEARPGETQRDDIVVVEVMDERLDREWWAACRARLEARFGQEELVVRALEFARL